MLESIAQADVHVTGGAPARRAAVCRLALNSHSTAVHGQPLGVEPVDTENILGAEAANAMALFKIRGGLSFCLGSANSPVL